MDIGTYFQQRLGDSFDNSVPRVLDEQQLSMCESCSLDSPVGREARLAIDVAADVLASSEVAGNTELEIMTREVVANRIAIDVLG